jgi:hypothetical protein
MSLRVGVQVLFVVIWSLALAAHFGLLYLEDLIKMNLYQYFGIAAFLGWLSGNAYSYRWKKSSEETRRPDVWGYVLAPPGLIYLLHAANDLELQRQVPLAPIYASAVFGVMFLVPTTLGKTKPGR